MSAVHRLRAPGAPTGVRCVPDPASPVPLMHLVGELDLASAATLRTTLHKMLTDEPAGVVLDASGLTVAEEVALSLFAAFADTAAQWPGCPVVLCAPSPTLA